MTAIERRARRHRRGVSSASKNGQFDHEGGRARDAGHQGSAGKRPARRYCRSAAERQRPGKPRRRPRTPQQGPSTPTSSPRSSSESSVWTPRGAPDCDVSAQAARPVEVAPPRRRPDRAIRRAPLERADVSSTRDVPPVVLVREVEVDAVATETPSRVAASLGSIARARGPLSRRRSFGFECFCGIAVATRARRTSADHGLTRARRRMRRQCRSVGIPAPTHTLTMTRTNAAVPVDGMAEEIWRRATPPKLRSEHDPWHLRAERERASSRQKLRAAGA